MTEKLQDTSKRKELHILEYYLPLFYVLCQYNTMTLATFSAALIPTAAVVLIYFLQERRISIFRPLLYLVIFLLIHDLIKAFIVKPNINAWIERIIYLLMVFTACNNLSEDHLFKAWRFFGIIAMLGILYQTIMIYVVGQSVSMIRILPTAATDYKYFMLSSRPSSFFLEPAAYSTWIMPLLFLSIKRGKLMLAAAVSLTILLSTSSLGILFALVLWICYILSPDRHLKIAYRVILSICLFGAFIAFTQLEVFQTAFEKITNISTDNASNNARLLLGFEVYGTLSIPEKLLGISQSSILSYMLSGKIDLQAYGLSEATTWLGFVNAISNSLILYGVGGCALYLLTFLQILRRIKRTETTCWYAFWEYSARACF